MKKFYHQHHKSILWQAMQLASILSLFMYALPRILFYDFPVSWYEEVLYFAKIYSCSLFIITSATGGPALLYRYILKLRLHK